MTRLARGIAFAAIGATSCNCLSSIHQFPLDSALTWTYFISSPQKSTTGRSTGASASGSRAMLVSRASGLVGAGVGSVVLRWIGDGYLNLGMGEL